MNASRNVVWTNFFWPNVGMLCIYEKTVVAQNKSNLLPKNLFNNMAILQLIQLKMA
jgi:hypothetical protein